MLHKTRAFTLIELLVVIAIIGILATLGSVAFSGSREKGRNAKRRGDLATLKSGLEYYSANEEYYPDVDNWDNLVQKLKDNGVFLSDQLKPVDSNGSYCYYLDTTYENYRYLLLATAMEEDPVINSFEGSIPVSFALKAEVGTDADNPCPAVEEEEEETQECGGATKNLCVKSVRY